MVDAVEVVVIAGLAGQEEYSSVFKESIENWKSACKSAEVPCRVIGSVSSPDSGDEVKKEVQKRLSEKLDEELWVVMIGHGTFNGREAKFNIAGDDFTAKEFGKWCEARTGELVVVNTSSSSSPYLQACSGENRTVITATKSANEIYYTRFGSYFSKAITGQKESDLDNDDQVSLLEAYIYAANQVADFFAREGRLATEHSLLDDNGDTLGTRAEWFEGTTAVKVAKEGAEPDGLRAMQQVLVKNELERSFPR